MARLKSPRCCNNEPSNRSPRRGRGAAQRPAGGADFAACAAGHGHRVPPGRPAAAGGHPISAEAVTDTRLASTISTGGAKVQTVEHMMSACAGLGIDNLYIDITADEVPILDGSASSFVFLLQSAGIALQKAPQALHPRDQAGGGARRRGRQREMGAPGAVPRLQAQPSKSTSTTGGQLHRPARGVRPGLGIRTARHRAGPYLRLHQGRRVHARQGPGAGRRAGQRHRDGRLPRCSTPTACATTTSS
jgi:hypothetical protein